MTVSKQNRPRLTWFAALNLLLAVLLATGIATYQVGRFWEHHMFWWFCMLLAAILALLVFWGSLTWSSQRMRLGCGSARLGFADIMQALTLAGCAAILCPVLINALQLHLLLIPLFGALLFVSITELPRFWQGIRHARTAVLLRKR